MLEQINQNKRRDGSQVSEYLPVNAVTFVMGEYMGLTVAKGSKLDKRLCSVALKASEICEHKKLCWDVEWRHPNYDIWQTSSAMKTNSKVSRMRSMNSIMNERLDGNCHWDWKSRPQRKILSQWWPSTRDLTNLSMYLPWNWRLLCIEVWKCNSEIEIKIFLVNMIFQALFHDKITVMAEWQQRQELLMTG